MKFDYLMRVLYPDSIYKISCSFRPRIRYATKLYMEIHCIVTFGLSLLFWYICLYILRVFPPSKQKHLISKLNYGSTNLPIQVWNTKLIINYGKKHEFTAGNLIRILLKTGFSTSHPSKYQKKQKKQQKWLWK